MKRNNYFLIALVGVMIFLLPGINTKAQVVGQGTQGIKVFYEEGRKDYK